MAEPRRISATGIAVILALLVASIFGVWLWQRPKTQPPPETSLAQLDVVCHGRIDGLKPVASLDPSIPGKIAEVFVTDGQHVSVGSKLLRLDDESAKLHEEEAKLAVKLAVIETQVAKQELLAYPTKKAAAEGSVTAANARVLAAERLLEERKLQQKMFMTGSAAEIAAAEAEVAQLRQLAAVEKARVEELAGLNPQLKVDAAEARRTAADITLKQAEKVVRDCVLTAPADGTVLRVQVSAGESFVPTGLQPAIVFRPDGPLVVRAEIDQEFLGRVKPGMEAKVTDDVRPDAPIWKGKVERVGNWVARRRSIVLEPNEINDVRTVECVISLEGNPADILPGQRVRVRIAREQK